MADGPMDDKVLNMAAFEQAARELGRQVSRALHGIRLGAQATAACCWIETILHPDEKPGVGKFKEEAEELIADPTNPVEAADVFIALVIYAERMGWDLADEVAKKMVINRARTWGEPNAAGVRRHL